MKLHIENKWQQMNSKEIKTGDSSSETVACFVHKAGIDYNIFYPKYDLC